MSFGVQMNIGTIARRLRQGDLQYILGRFKTIRRAYSGLQHLRETLTLDVDSPGVSRRTLFPNVNVDEAVRTIQKDAVFLGLKLPIHVIKEIEEFARCEPLHAIYDPNGPTFYYSDVTHGKCIDGRSMPIGGVRDPIRCPAVREIVDDPVLRSIIRTYLGYEPKRIVTILDWSFASSFTDEERRQLRHLVIDYHYDVGGFNFLYTSFYITDTNRYSGAHVMMKGSHNRKPVRMLLGSTTASETAVYKQFGKENEICIEGPAGTGFVQDTSCYHRATAPTHGDRLMLAIRCS
jgi:hypothetical protein